MRHGFVACVLGFVLFCLPGCGGSGGGGTPEPTVLVTSLANGGAGTLRDALENAVAGERIGFEPSLSGAIILTTPLEIDGDLTIEGRQGNPVRLTSNGVILIEVAEGANVFLSNVDIRDVTGQPLRLIHNSGLLVMTGVTIRDCDAANNAVYNLGTLHMRDCVVSGCQGTNGAVVRANNATTVIDRCAFFGNEANASGGAIRHIGGVMHVINTLLHDNQANAVAPMSGSGGAIASTASVQDPNPVLIVVHCTITGNRGDFLVAGIYARNDGGGHVEIRGSVVAQNTSPNDPDVWIDGAAVTASHNVVGVGDGTDFVNGVNDNVAGTSGAPLDPLLAPFAAAGATFVRPPQAGSPAADLVPASACLDPAGAFLALDQRRAPRTGFQCDAGSYER